ncbi:SIMPL domain-containing protein [Tessaracoccus sp. HDW20]|uniref:SIMPL domain-containing protein n=1 Tax=Tessaracoccus coleopterorum TaxID=2714950 RepID=UPI0018D2F4CB|nr:SIMPL domain-containing protein [Tessaracoccus coleopterorum]NHB84923.1 SIMPL domain-containing protein [Tessaracoccus coleopterorum]
MASFRGDAPPDPAGGAAGAFEDARQRAQWIAEAADQTELSVVRIDDGGAPHFGFGQSGQMMLAKDSAPSFDLDPQDVEVAANLSVTFRAGS